MGIVNQASESAWFPAAVENAARMNRDFQDRLLSQQKNGGAGAGAGGLGAGGLGGGGLQGLLGGLAPKPGGAGGKGMLILFYILFFAVMFIVIVCFHYF